MGSRDKNMCMALLVFTTEYSEYSVALKKIVHSQVLF
jgi:hypothetical protein